MKLPLLAAVAIAAGSLAACRDPRPEPDAAGASAATSIEAALPAFLAAEPPERSPHPRVAGARRDLASGAHERAAESLRALAREDTSGEAAFLLGWLHEARQQYALALPWFAEALAAGPAYPKAGEVFWLYGRSLEETGDLEGARAAYRADARLYPDRGDGPFRIARIDFEQGRLEACVENAREALARFRRPEDVAKVHALLADVHLARGELVEAQRELTRCVETFPHYEALYKLSRVSARLGDHEAAERYLDRHRAAREAAGR